MENLKKDKIRVSAVSYLNTLPLIFGLTHSKVMQKIHLSLDNPSVCAQKLINAEADLGLVPVASIPQISNASIVSNYCIGADGAVKTVLLLSDHPLNKIKTIFLDTESRTSVKLVRVLAEKFWKREFTWKPLPGIKDNSPEPAAVVLIGDKTFVEKTKYKYSIDLAEEWKNFTGLPFVFACWVANKPLPQQFINDFDDAQKFGLLNLDASIALSESKLISKTGLKDYLLHSISYDFDDAKKKAMDLFLKNSNSFS
jgi:chorismate dehydratase